MTISAGVVQLGNTNAAQNSAISVGVNNGLSFASGITAITVGGLAGSGNLSLANAGSAAVALTEGGSGSTGTYSGVLSGVGSLKINGGILTLSGANTFTGGVTISAGKLLANNTAGSATGTGTVAIGSGGTFGGSGNISGAVNVSSGGFLTPGSGSTTAILGTGTLTLSSGASFDCVINGTAAGTGYDQVNVTGNATVTGSALSLSGSSTAHDGSQLTIVKVSGTETGTFTSLAQGGMITSDGVTYTASYVGGTGHSIVLTASPAASSTAVTSSINSVAFGQSVTFTASVSSSSSGTPTGTVTFKDGSTTLGNGTLNGSAQAIFSTSSLSGGSHSVTAVYGGDANFAASVSSARSQTINQDSTATAISSSSNSLIAGQSVTFTATVTANSPGSGIPTGIVSFLDGSTTLGTAR